MLKLVAAILASLALATPHHATPVPTEPPREMQPKPSAPEKPAEKAAAPAEEPPVTTRHSITVSGKKLSYTAAAGFLPVVADNGDVEANIFFISYTLDGEKPEQRPVIFAFNGGPGSSSVWLHLGAIGPKRVEMLPDGRMPEPPFRLVDNEQTWLDQADLVFVDPVGTGFSRATKPELTQKFTTVQGDVDSLRKFVRLYLTRFGRWQSPLFITGESYGTFRSAALADQLADRGMALNGLIFISSILNMQTAQFHPLNDLPYALFLPSYTATAWYHGKLAPDLQADLDKAVTESEKWAAEGYTLALAKGSALTPQERKEAVNRLARLTGLERELIENRNLRVDNFSFARELLRARGETAGFLDSRFTAPNTRPASSWAGFDPTLANIRPPYTTAFNAYVRNTLGFRSDLEYFILGEGIGRWDWEVKNAYADVTEDLAQAMAKNRYMKVFVASGLFDLATPHYATDYTLRHLPVPDELRKNIAVRTYRTGHMIYLDRKAIQELKRDVAGFIAGALPSAVAR